MAILHQERLNRFLESRRPSIRPGERAWAETAKREDEEQSESRVSSLHQIDRPVKFWVKAGF
jgi:hypothetical protein